MGCLGNLLDARECRVDFEHARKVLGALSSKLVAADTKYNDNLALGGTDGVHGSQSGPGGTRE